MITPKEKQQLADDLKWFRTTIDATGIRNADNRATLDRIERAARWSHDNADDIVAQAVDFKSLLIDELYFILSGDNYGRNAFIEDTLIKAGDFLNKRVPRAPALPTDNDALYALERLEKTFDALMSNPTKPEIFGLPTIDFETIRQTLKKASQ